MASAEVAVALEGEIVVIMEPVTAMVMEAAVATDMAAVAMEDVDRIGHSLSMAITVVLARRHGLARQARGLSNGCQDQLAQGLTEREPKASNI